MKKRKVTLITIIAVLFALITLKLMSNKSVIDEKKQIKTDINTTVSIKKVVKKVQNSSLSLVGITEAKQSVDLKSETSGQIVAINFNLGDYVTQGQVLIEIDDKLAQLALKSAQINLSKLEDEYNKTKNLYTGKATSETQVRDARVDYEKAKLSVEQADKQLSFTKIKATQNGYVVSKSVDKGTLVNMGSPILSIVDISKLKVKIKATEKDIYRLKKGQLVRISSSIYPGIEYTGKVSFVSQQGDELHNYPVEILVDNKSDHQLKAGSFVNVDFDFTSQTTLVIPRETIIGSVKNAMVYVIDNNKAFKRQIVIGQDFNDYLEVLSGLKEGDNVVMTGQINLSDGATVSIINK